MAVSERSFADRYGRGVQMHAAIVSFTPEFAPVYNQIEPTAFLTFLESIDELNTEVGALTTSYSAEATARVTLVRDLKKLCSRVRKLVESNPAWANHVPGIQRLVRKIRGYKLKRPKPPAAGEAEESEPAKRRNQGEQSYAEITENFEQLIAAAQAITGYAPPAAEIGIAALQAQASDLSAKNSSMAALDNQIGQKQRKRLSAYNGPGGLKELMKAIKKAVAAQYGTDSTEYAAVKSIKL